MRRHTSHQAGCQTTVISQSNKELHILRKSQLFSKISLPFGLILDKIVSVVK